MATVEQRIRDYIASSSAAAFLTRESQPETLLNGYAGRSDLRGKLAALAQGTEPLGCLQNPQVGFDKRLINPSLMQHTLC